MSHEFGAKRSNKWPTLRKNFLAGKSCALCGGKKKLEAHHVKPFHLFPDLELDPTNLIPLCEGYKDIDCHLIWGHFGNFKLGYNLTVASDTELWYKRLSTHKG